jgi:hypothetical protein
VQDARIPVCMGYAVLFSYVALGVGTSRKACAPLYAKCSSGTGRRIVSGATFVEQTRREMIEGPASEDR